MLTILFITGWHDRYFYQTTIVESCESAPVSPAEVTHSVFWVYDMNGGGESFTDDKGGFMRKIAATLIIASLLSASTVAPVFANGWNGGYSHGRGYGFNPFWPVVAIVNAALYIPAAIIGTVAQLATPQPVVYGYAPPPAPVRVYSEPATYYEPRYSYAPAPNDYYAPTPQYQQRVYVAPSESYSPSNNQQRSYAPIESYTPPYYITR
jgi:hypothetical protein